MQLTTRSVKAILGATTIGSFALTDPTFAAAQTFLGNAANNALGGQVQVQITVDGGKITAISTPVTLSGRNAQFANYAVPTLTSRALAAQSANIQGVSGATYVSSAWKQSLASAIAKAGTAITGGTTTSSTPAPTPTKTAAPAPANPTPPATRFGEGDDDGEHEGFESGEGGDDGYRTVRPPHRIRTQRPLPVTPVTPKTPTASTTDPALGLTMGAGVIKKSIICVKGNVTKSVKAVNPKCPTGYTLKKK
jgi:major membrane immunogen (membrane-anchored lipoprotein)